MSKTKKLTKKRVGGSSLIELLIAAAVIGLVLTAISAGLVYSIKTTAATKNRDYATQQANLILEVFSRERSALGWDEFSSKSTAQATFCFATIPAIGEAFDPGACSASEVVTSANTEFTREADVIPVAAERIRVEARITWSYDGQDRDVVVAKEFRRTQ